MLSKTDWSRLKLSRSEIILRNSLLYVDNKIYRRKAKRHFCKRNQGKSISFMCFPYAVLTYDNFELSLTF